MNEQWCSIDGYPDYEVSDQGRVRRITARTCAKAGAILSTRGLRGGYPCVDLSRPGEKKRTHLVHRLVAAAFLESADGREVNHISGDKTDARSINLEYVTSSENQQHAYRAGLQDASGEKNGQAKLTWDAVRRIRAIAAQPDRPSYAAIGRQFSITGGNVLAIVKGKTWQERRAEAVPA